MTALDRAHREEHDAKIAHIGQIWECLERTSAEAEGVRELRRAWVREMRLDVEDGAVIQVRVRQSVCIRVRTSPSHLFRRGAKWRSARAPVSLHYSFSSLRAWRAQGIRATLRARSFDEFRQAARKLQLLVHPDKHREGTQQSLAKAWPDGDPLSDFVKCAINRPTPWTDYVSRVCHLLVKISEMCPATTATTTTVLLPSVHSILEELR